MKYLITGIEGFVGGYLLEELLASGEEIYGTYYDETTLTDSARKRCTLNRIDIRDQRSVLSCLSAVKPDVIFHLAAQSSAAVSWKNPQLTMDINVNGTINLLECVKASTIDCRIVMIGSSEQYGIVDPQDNPIDERQPLSPGNPYSISKMTCEELCRLYIRSFGMDIVMTRSFNHIGIRQSTQFVIADFAKRIAEISVGKRDPVFEVGNLSAQRDFTDVRDVVKAYVIVAQKGEVGEVYNVGSGFSDTIQHFLDYMIEKERVNVKITQDSNRMRPSDNPVICCDNTKLKSLGWTTTIDVYTTIDDMIDYAKRVCVN